MRGVFFFFLLMAAVLAPAAARGQERATRIGEIEFFGYAGVDLGKVRAALPFREGDEMSRESSERMMKQARQAVRRVLGREPTEAGPVCCDERGNVTVFIGLAGRPFRYRPAPKGAARLTPSAVELYREWSDALEEALRTGANAEDWSKGYALSTASGPLRAVQLKARAYAVRHERLLRRVLQSSADASHRAMAAELLGYARRSAPQVAALAEAGRDADGTVRNNATRALGVLVSSEPGLARRIPAEGFVEMLLSGTWTDVNKASLLLSVLTSGRDPRLLARLKRPEVLTRLAEIARWRTGHANAARVVLGRVAGIEESRLQRLVAGGQVDVILDAVDSR